MKIEVKLYGALKTKYEKSRQQESFEIEMPEGAKPVDLLIHLDIHDQRHVVVIMDGRVLQAGDELQDGKSASVFYAVYGG